VPLLFYQRAKLEPSRKGITTQHADIFPSVIDYLSIDQELIAFGNSVFSDDKASFAVNYINDTYQLIQGDHSLQFDGEKSIALYDHKRDPLMQDNLLSKEVALAKQMENKLKAIIQQYQQALIENQLTPNE
jgi:arylsulfatase A-like enzyme